MANTLGAYNPIFYASEALIHLRKELGLAGRVHRGVDAERRSFSKGEYARIRKPSTFSAQDAPSTAQDLTTQYVEVQLNYWREVKYALTDRERAFTDDQIIAEHIAPAAYALGDDVDQKLAALYKEVPWLHDYGSEADHDIIVDARKVMRDMNVPLNDGKLHFMVDSTVETYFLKSTAFHRAGSAGAAPLMRGSLGTRFGVECFANQNTPTHTPGTVCASGGDAALAVNNAAGYAAGTTTIAADGGTGSETIAVGDTFVIAGNTQRYAVTAAVTLSSGAGNISFTPGLAAAVADNAVITFTQQTATAHSQNLMFHENAFALVVAPLSDDIPGAEAFTAVDPVSGLSVRARRFYVGDESKLYMALDVLFGVKVLDNNLAVRSWT
jgi:hypothetical protein